MVIGILAGISIVAYSGVTTQARGTALADSIKKVEQAFYLKAQSEGRTTWWPENELVGTANPSIASIISGTDLNQYLISVPTISGLSSLYWFYDNDGDSYGSCNSSAVGVNIILYNVPNDVAQVVDTKLDDGNLGCGNVRVTTELLYGLSSNGDIQ